MSKTTPKPTSKRAQLIKLINRKSGASIAAIQKQLAWKPHTIRAEISRLRKNGLNVCCHSTDNGPVYRTHTEADA